MKNLLIPFISIIFISISSQASSAPISDDSEVLESKVKRLESKIERLESLLVKMETQIKESVYSKISKNISNLESNIQDKVYSKVSSDIEAIEAEVQTKVNEEFASNLATLSPAAGSGLEGIKMSMKPSPKIESTDGKYSFQPFGRIHMDYTTFNDSTGGTNHPDNTDWRRARFGFKGKLGNDLSYKYEMDLGGESVAYKEIYLQYSGLAAGDLKVGHIKPFQSLSNMTSSNYITFTERSAPVSVFARGEVTGAAFQSHGEQWGARVGVFGREAGTGTDTDDEDFSVTGRVSAAPINEKGKLVHLGASASYRDNKDSDFELQTKGETGEGVNLLDSGDISSVKDSMFYGLEAAATHGSLSGQAEYFMADVNRDGASDGSFDGWYTQVSYLLTGETRPYSVSSGTHKRIKPKKPFDPKNNAWGAWEVAGRFSNTDLNDTSAGLTFGEMDIWTTGVNWYLNDHSRFMANYRKAETDANASIANEDLESFTLRAQFDF